MGVSILKGHRCTTFLSYVSDSVYLFEWSPVRPPMRRLGHSGLTTSHLWVPSGSEWVRDLRTIQEGCVYGQDGFVWLGFWESWKKSTYSTLTSQKDFTPRVSLSKRHDRSCVQRASRSLELVTTRVPETETDMCTTVGIGVRTERKITESSEKDKDITS